MENQPALKLLKYAGYPLCFLLGLVLFDTPLVQLIRLKLFPPPLQTLISPDNKHHAVLTKKYNLADENFVVTVDGKQVYISPDYAPLQSGLYRETLQWDETGRVVLLELLGKRVFAYDTFTRQPLRKGELQTYKFYPARGEYYFYTEIRDLDE